MVTEFWSLGGRRAWDTTTTPQLSRLTVAGGTRGGIGNGATDALGGEAVELLACCYDLRATGMQHPPGWIINA